MRRRFWPLLLSLLALGGMVLAACGGGGAPAPEAVQEEAPAAVQAEAATPTTPPTATSIPPSESAASASELGEPPAFTEALHATDPSTVVLGAGQPQLIEFFAFW